LIFLAYVVAKATTHKASDFVGGVEIAGAELQRLKPRDHVHRAYRVVEPPPPRTKISKMASGAKAPWKNFIFGGVKTPPFRFRHRAGDMAGEARALRKQREDVRMWQRKDAGLKPGATKTSWTYDELSGEI
jgi:hypothetical protein